MSLGDKKSRLLDLFAKGKEVLMKGVSEEDSFRLAESMEYYKLASKHFKEALGIPLTAYEKNQLAGQVVSLERFLQETLSRIQGIEDDLEGSDGDEEESEEEEGQETEHELPATAPIVHAAPQAPVAPVQPQPQPRARHSLASGSAQATPVQRPKSASNRKSLGAIAPNAVPTATPRKSSVGLPSTAAASSSAAAAPAPPPRKPPVPVFRKQAPAAKDASAAPEAPVDKTAEYVAAAQKHGVKLELYEAIMNEVIDRSIGVSWDDIAGLELAKDTLDEAVILPTRNPELFTGLRAPPKGVLLFGPPGNGKTMLAKAVASESNATFFSISASSLVSKWVGESERLCRALFAAARENQPAVIFIDEIDSMLSARSANENESSRRLKTEFLVQMDGCATVSGERLLVMGATNRPQELDDAALRRFTKRILIPLPEIETRLRLIKHLLKEINVGMTPEEELYLAEITDGYSGSDLSGLCSETAKVPIREVTRRSRQQAEQMKAEELRAVMLSDFQETMKHIRPSTKQELLEQLKTWNENFGCSS